MDTLIRHGFEEQRRKYLPRTATEELRLHSMGVAEPMTDTGTDTDTTRIKTTAARKSDRYFINWQKFGSAGFSIST